MKLDYLLLADKAEAINGKLYVLGGAIGAVGLIQIPGPAQFDVAVGLLVDYAETSDTHRLTLAMETADNEKVLGPVEIPFATGCPPGLPPGDSMPFTVVIQGPFPIPTEGAFQWAIEVDGLRHEPRHFRVSKITPLTPSAT